MIDAILRRPVSVIVTTLAVSTLGVFSLLKLPLSLLPSIERPSLVITARAAAVSRDEMLREVTEPVEQRLPSVRGVTAVESETSAGLSRIIVESAWQTDPDRLRIDIARRLETAVSIRLDELTVETRTADQLPVIEVAVSGGSLQTRTRFAQEVLLPELARVESAGDVDVVGATPLRMTVEPRAAALAARDLTASDVLQRLSLIGQSESAGRAKEGASVRPIVMTDRVSTPAQLAATGIPSGDAIVPLGEVASIALTPLGDGTSFRMLAGKVPFEGVLLRVYRAPDGNAVSLAREVRERVDDLQARTRDVRLHVVSDRSREVTRALIELIAAALAGILLGTLVLRFVLRDWRPTLALTIIVPVAILASFSVFYAFGIPIDVVSLAGLALATGLLVDNSIVVLEAIESARAAGSRNPVADGTRQIVVAVVASSTTLVIVFAPLLYLRGLARAIFGEQAVAVVASVTASLLLSLTLTPILARRAGVAANARNPGSARYMALLQRISRRPATALISALILTAVAIAAAALLPRELFAPGVSQAVVMEFRPVSLLDDQSARALAAEVWNSVISGIDRAHIETAVMTFPEEERDASIEIRLTDPAHAGAVIAAMRTRAAALPTVRSEVGLRRSSFVEAITGDSDQVELIASAPTAPEARTLAARVMAEAQERGLVPIQQSRRITRSALQLDWDEARLASLGTTRAAVENDVKAALGHLDAGRSDLSNSESAIRLLPTTPAELPVVPVRAGDSVVPLASLAAIRLVQNEPVVDRDEGRPAVRLLFRGRPGHWGDFPLAARERLRVAGHAGEIDAAYAQLRLAAILAIILLYLTVAAFYESLVLPLLVMVAVPFAAGGGIVALLLFGQSINIMSIIGLIFLAGVVVNHTVVLLDRAEQLRREGNDEESALWHAVSDRYRPVIMTTVTAILGMLPLAVLGGDGVELRRPIAIVVIGGLLTATAGTLLIIPLLHRAIEPWRRRTRRRGVTPVAGAEAEHA